MEIQDRNIVSSALHGGNPYKSYIKTILGKVYVTIWNSFENIPEGLILSGDPRKGDESCSVDVWSQDEDYYFTTKNKRHLLVGNIIVHTRKSDPVEKTVEGYSDEDLEKLLDERFKKFFSLQTLLNDTDSIALLFRIKRIAEDKERSDKIIKAIESRISELQASEYKSIPSVVETEL